MEIKARSRVKGRVAILELSGRFDAYETLPVKEWLSQAADSPPALVVINMAGVNFIDSSGLALLVQGMKHCRRQNGDLALCHFQKSVQTIFELSCLDKTFNVFASEEEAVAAFTVPSLE